MVMMVYVNIVALDIIKKKMVHANFKDVKMKIQLNIVVIVNLVMKWMKKMAHVRHIVKWLKVHIQTKIKLI